MPTLSQLAAAAVAIGLCAGLSGCESMGFETKEARAAQDQVRGQTPGPLDDRRKNILGDDGLGVDLLGGGEDKVAGAQLPVNKYLWRGTLDTLSFLPLTSTDPYGGVIVTDWGTAPDAPGERFKVTAYITSAALKPQSLNVVVNRQKRSESGDWVAAPVAEETTRQLEDAILTRARQLRSGDAEQEG